MLAGEVEDLFVVPEIEVPGDVPADLADELLFRQDARGPLVERFLEGHRHHLEADGQVPVFGVERADDLEFDLVHGHRVVGLADVDDPGRHHLLDHPVEPDRTPRPARKNVAGADLHDLVLERRVADLEGQGQIGLVGGSGGRRRGLRLSAGHRLGLGRRGHGSGQADRDDGKKSRVSFEVHGGLHPGIRAYHTFGLSGLSTRRKDGVKP